VLNEGTIMDSTMEGEGRNSNVFVKAREDIVEALIKQKMKVEELGKGKFVKFFK
jgi:hypothetical protein